MYLGTPAQYEAVIYATQVNNTIVVSTQCADSCPDYEYDADNSTTSTFIANTSDASAMYGDVVALNP